MQMVNIQDTYGNFNILISIFLVEVETGSAINDKSSVYTCLNNHAVMFTRLNLPSEKLNWFDREVFYKSIIYLILTINNLYLM
jgi:hypothetical protein